MNLYPLARFGAAVAVAFVGVLVFAAGFDLTRFSGAQAHVASGPSVPAPAVSSLAETQNAFETIVDRVKPAVVTIHVAKYATPAAQRRGRGQNRNQQLPPGFED